MIGNSGSQPSFKMVNNQAKRFSALNISDPVIQAAAQRLQNQFGSFKNIRNSQKLNFKIKGQQYFVLVAPWQDKFGLDWLIVTVVPESYFMARIYANTGPQSYCVRSHLLRQRQVEFSRAAGLLAPLKV